MRISLILAHPDSGSLNHAIARAASEQLEKNGHEVDFHDLYREGFNPSLPAEELASEARLPADIAKLCEEARQADGFVIVHPNWWGQPPAILKGWVDRVLRAGVAYRFLEGDGGEGVPVGLLRAKAAVVLNTSNTPGERERRVFGDPLEALWKRCIFDLCGVGTVDRRMFSVVVTSTREERMAWLQEVRRMVTNRFGLAPGHSPRTTRGVKPTGGRQLAQKRIDGPRRPARLDK
jgi:putative NADPH-quinone reductase